ncbi:hypothetical protein D3C78_1542300 [compost metagenome]
MSPRVVIDMPATREPVQARTPVQAQAMSMPTAPRHRVALQRPKAAGAGADVQDDWQVF